MKKIIVIALVTLVFLISNTVLASENDSLRNESGIAVEKSLSQTNPTIHDGDGNGNAGDSPQQYGSISGSVYGTFGWATFPVPFALVSAGGRSVMANLVGNYIIQNLPLGQTYQVTASGIGYVSQTFSVALTSGNPCMSVDFILVLGSGGGGGKFYAAFPSSALETEKTIVQ